MTGADRRLDPAAAARRALAAAACLVVALSGCSVRDGGIVIGEDSPPGTLIVQDAPEVISSVSARCHAGADGTSGDLAGVFEQEWSRITIASSRTTYRDIAAETGAAFDERLLDSSPSIGAIVLQHDGRAVAAYETEDLPFDLDAGPEMVSLDAPGAFTRERGFCVVDG